MPYVKAALVVSGSDSESPREFVIEPRYDGWHRSSSGKTKRKLKSSLYLTIFMKRFACFCHTQGLSKLSVKRPSEETELQLADFIRNSISVSFSLLSYPRRQLPWCCYLMNEQLLRCFSVCWPLQGTWRPGGHQPKWLMNWGANKIASSGSC